MNHPFSPRWQRFSKSHEKQKVTFHENFWIPFYKHWSKTLQKARKGFRLQKQRPNQDSFHFQLSHCCFILAPTFLPFLTSTNNNKSVAWFFWKKWERHWNFDIFDWKLVLSSISQGQSYNQKVALFRCPSDLTNFVKICVFVQSSQGVQPQTYNRRATVFYSYYDPAQNLKTSCSLVKKELMFLQIAG